MFIDIDMHVRVYVGVCMVENIPACMRICMSVHVHLFVCVCIHVYIIHA